mgnify:CR=1 FL=1
MLFDLADLERQKVLDAIKAFAECQERQAALLEGRPFSQQRVEAVVNAQMPRSQHPHPAFDGQ